MTILLAFLLCSCLLVEFGTNHTKSIFNFRRNVLMEYGMSSYFLFDMISRAGMNI